MYNFQQQQQMNGNSINFQSNNMNGNSINFQSNNMNNIQMQSAYSYNPGMNSPIPSSLPPQIQGRMSMGQHPFNNQGCPPPMMGNYNNYNQQMFFTDSMMTAPGSFSSFFNLNDASCNDNIEFDNMMNFDPTPRKRNFDLIDNPQMEQMQQNNKKMKTAPTNDNYRRSLNIGFVRVTSLKKVFSCFIGGCRFKTFSCQQFVQHLSFFHNDQRDVLRGFCMICENFDCGCSIYNEFVHLYGHSSDLPQHQQAPQNNSQLNIKEVVSQADYIKKEVECDIVDEPNFANDENTTDVSNADESEARTSTPEAEEESIPIISDSNDQMTMEETQIIPMEPPTDLNIDKTIQIKQEVLPLPEIENLESTVVVPETETETQEEEEEEEDLLVPIDPVFKLPESGPKIQTKKPNKTLRKRAMSTFVESDKKSSESSKKRKSQTTEDINSDTLSDTMCLDFISKKIIDAKKKENDDKFKNFKPNESIFKLVDITSIADEETEEKESRDSVKARREVQKEKLKSKFNNFNEKKHKLRPRKLNEEEKEPTMKTNFDDISFSNITIDNLIEKIKNTKKIEDMPQRSKQKSTIAEYFQKPDSRDNIVDDLMIQNVEEKTPQKNESNRKKRNSGKENDEKIEETRRSLRTRRSGSDDKAPEKSRNSVESNNSTSFNEKSSTSINSSASALEVSKLIPQTIDIEKLIANASSNFEFGSIKDLYPWIDENITSTIFKTKTSIDILLNEFSLFSTYKCMNELCYFFTTDLEEFKKHSRSHDSYNNYCSYCLKCFEKSNDLCNHLEVEHKFDRFQCSKCMFRSCQKGYVDVHQRVHHAEDENCEVFKSPVQKLLKSDRSKCMPTLLKNREKLIMPYRCKTPKCKEIFYCKDNFRKHLDIESNKPSNQEFVTLICQQLYSIDHSRTGSVNTEGIYQCLHCQYGTDESDIFDHMALNHPHEFAYICKRVKPQRLIELNIMSARETLENSTSIEYIGTTTAEAKSFGGDLEKLISTNLEKEAVASQRKNKFIVSEVVSLDD